jgi:hypothetical protein
VPLFGRDRGRIESAQTRALEHPTRMRIWSLFTGDTDRPLTAAALRADLMKETKFREVTVSQVSYHLAVLKDAELLPTD